jgi:LmbE family N-acetylglucosaminyl deacetylase
MSVLILAPHCDDVPFSLGGTLLQGALGADIRTLIVFSQSRHTAAEPGTAPLEATTATRYHEERIAGQIAHYDVSFLGFPEPFARPGYGSLLEIFDEDRDPFLDPVWPEVSRIVGPLIQSHKGVILAPLGYGNHVDHRMVSRLLRDNLENRNLIPIFYEDLTYAAVRDDEILSRLSPNDSHNRFYALKMPMPSLDPKLELLRVYKSQMTEDYYQALLYHWNKHKGEYLWITRAGEAALEKLKI